MHFIKRGHKVTSNVVRKRCTPISIYWRNVGQNHSEPSTKPVRRAITKDIICASKEKRTLVHCWYITTMESNMNIPQNIKNR